MNTGRTVFSQLMDFLPLHEFHKCVERYQGNYRTRRLSCRDQFLCLIFAQLTGRESLREVVVCLRTMGHRLYHAGIRGRISRSTLADANETRDWRIYADFAMTLIQRARTLYHHEPLPEGIEQSVYAFDSTTIDLCLKLFPWAKFRRRKSAVKIHTLIELRGSIPCFLHITGGKVHDVLVLNQLPIEAGAFYVMDRGYIDFARLYRITQNQAFFVTRAETNQAYKRQSYRSVDKTTGLRSDTTIRLSGPLSSRRYPQPLRRIAYYDEELDKRFVFLSNNFQLPALVIAELYRRRWAVELFFKWIKQNLRIKAFYGYSINAVKTQIWISMCVYLLVAILRKELGIERSMSDLLQILSLTLFEKEPISRDFFEEKSHHPQPVLPNQLSLFEL